MMHECEEGCMMTMGNEDDRYPQMYTIGAAESGAGRRGIGEDKRRGGM
jgi:hypothetical protein